MKYTWNVITKMVALEFWYSYSCKMHALIDLEPLSRGTWLFHTAGNQVMGVSDTAARIAQEFGNDAYRT